MRAFDRPETTGEAMPVARGPAVVPITALEPIRRHAYAPPRGRHSLALAGTSLIFGAALVGLLVSFEGATPQPQKPSVPLVVSLLPLASPTDTPPKAKVAPKPADKHERKSEPRKIEPVQHTVVPLAPVPAPPSVLAAKPVDPAPPRPEPGAPKTAPAPPAPQPASNAPDSWEGRVLARLEKFRRYPGIARSERQQGVAYIRFRMNRDGHLLSAALARSSGFPALDQAALDTLRRADPLPKIPSDRPDEVEIVVPVEFTIR